ncbi:uncharacterized protein BCR38DRAFT_485615 [Pseudomassariella vexata]|uniref:Uncharacterized protein n=1 Tax=Pseudomassariella vexata TaxID=1141098 RepID=A0A1Y2DYT3_9PEZI|nr:uncharacterized protein BCR38DRAFT_485615 [Pseudomassariella vexata]ORY64468.1 hypothetical protein BCR38DRAFT_485615 [Pseudomassariella vexata]
MSSTGDNKASAATWDNDRHEDLAVILADVSAPIGLENKAIITRKMQERGHNITWGGISAAPQPQSIVIIQLLAIMASGKWDEAKFFNLFIAIFTVTVPQLAKQLKDAVIQAMKANGYDTNGNAVR